MKQPTGGTVAKAPAPERPETTNTKPLFPAKEVYHRVAPVHLAKVTIRQVLRSPDLHLLAPGRRGLKTVYHRVRNPARPKLGPLRR
jgi:hypothetical protein